MNDRSDAGLVKRLGIFASFAAVFSMVVGLSVLAGWTLHIAALLTWGAGTPMAPNAAACFVLAGLSLWLLREKQNRSSAPVRNLTAKAAAAIVSLVGLLTLAEHLFTLNLGIDRLLLLGPPVGQTATSRILMSPITAGAFLLFGLALLGIDWRTRRGGWPAQFLCLGAALASPFGLVGVVLGPSVSPITLPLPTIVNFFVLAAGLLCSRASCAMGGLLTSKGAETKLLRRVLPASLLVLGLISWLISKAIRTEVHLTWVEASVLAAMTAAMLAGFVGWIAFIVDRNDAHRKKLEAVLQVSQEQLNQLLDRIEEPESEDRLRRRVKSGVAVAVLLTGLLGLLSWRMAQQAAENVDWVAHTQEVSATLELALRHLDDVETGARGFALSGAQDYLDPYETGGYEVGRDLQRLRFLMADNPDQEQRFSTLLEQANSKIGSSKALVAARQNSGTIPTVAQLERGKQIMDAARLTVKQMEDEEKGVLEKRTQRARVARDFTGSIIALGSILGVIFLSIAGITVSREIGVAARARAQVKALNSDLERRVEQRTTALQSEVAARIETEAKLRESEGRLAGVIASAMDSIITVDDQQRIVLFNCAAEKMFRCPGSEAIGQPITRFIPQRFHAGHSGHIRKFGETGVTNRAMGPKDVLWGLRASGQEFQIEASISHVVAGGKKLFTVILRDVTERKQAEEMRERLAAIVDSSDDAIISKTMDGTIAAWNRGAEKVFGYPASEAVGKPIQMLIPAERVNEESDILARIRHGLSVEHFETVRVRKDGTKIDVSVTISPIRDGNDTIVGASKIARDITERKRAEAAQARQAEELSHQAEELRHSQHALETQKLMLQSVLDSMVEGLVAANEQGKFILWNPAAEKILGLGAADLSPEEWSAHYGAYLPDTVTPFPNEQNPLLRAMGGEVRSAEIFFRNPALNREVWIECNGSPLRDNDGEVRGGVAAFRDITKRKADELEIRKLNENLEERIAKRTAQLEVANRELEAFSYSVSHDLRAPLRHIGGFSKILMQDFGPGMAVEARDHLQRIEDAVIRMGLLVDGLLSLARLGRQSLKLRHTDLNAVVDQVISVLQPEYEGRDVKWRIAPLPALECDQILMGQVLQNLIGNALKYSRGRASTVIEIGSIQQPGEPAVIFVRDNGAGFDMKYAQKLFGVFQRMHTESEFEGTGVGLATVQRIIQKHGGRVWAEAELDHGATFYFTLGANEQTGIAQEATAVI